MPPPRETDPPRPAWDRSRWPPIRPRLRDRAYTRSRRPRPWPKRRAAPAVARAHTGRSRTNPGAARYLRPARVGRSRSLSRSNRTPLRLHISRKKDCGDRLRTARTRGDSSYRRPSPSSQLGDGLQTYVESQIGDSARRQTFGFTVRVRIKYDVHEFNLPPCLQNEREDVDGWCQAGCLRLPRPRLPRD